MKEPDIHALLLVVSDACRYRPKYYFYIFISMFTNITQYPIQDVQVFTQSVGLEERDYLRHYRSKEIENLPKRLLHHTK